MEETKSKISKMFQDVREAQKRHWLDTTAPGWEMRARELVTRAVTIKAVWAELGFDISELS